MTLKYNGHMAGLSYFILVLSGIFSLAYMPSQIIDWNSPSNTVSNIEASESLLRLGIFFGAICYTAFLFLGLYLFRMFKSSSEFSASLLLFFVVVSVPLSFMGFMDLYEALQMVLSNAEHAQLSPEALNIEVMRSVQAYGDNVSFSQLFWGLWLLPFAYLIRKSGYIPLFFAVFLALGGIIYVAKFTAFLLLPDTSFNHWALDIPGTIGELGVCLWMLIMGAREKL